MIQIGMRCEPEWLCDSIAWVLAALAIGVVAIVIRAIIRERRKRK